MNQTHPDALVAEPPSKYVWSEESSLLPGEHEELQACERVIERGMQTFLEVAVALQTIRDKRLYRVSFDTWDAYCLDRWKFTARRAQQLCRAAETVRSLGLEDANADPGSQFAMPASEKHVRPLNDLPLEERRAAWSEAVSSAPSGRITAKHVADVVRARRVRLGMSVPETKEQSASVATAKAWVPREERLREQAALAIADVRALLAMAGTADSTKSANLNLALEQLQNFHDHLGNLRSMQTNRRANDRS